VKGSQSASVDTHAVRNRLHDGVVWAVLEDVLLAAGALPMHCRRKRALALARDAAQLVSVAGLADLARSAAVVGPAARVLARVLFRLAEEDGREEWQRRYNVLDRVRHDLTGWHVRPKWGSKT
jgi:hypothetical protein